MDTKALIEKILRDTKLLQSKSMEGRVYTDEPILHTAAQMARYLPEKYREMRRIATEPEARLRSEEWIFCRQGRFMEDYEDDYSYNGDFVRYFPTYQAMSDTQLRGYFSWRTKLRRGEPEPTSLSFLYVYIYELLNQIGVSSPEEGFRQLNTFWQYYRRMEPQLDRYLPLWLMDYAVYYGLEPEVLESFETVTRERAMADLLHADRQDTEALFEALCTLSTHNLCRSGFYKEHPEDVKAVTCAVFRRLMEHHEKRCKNTLFEKLFGHRVTVSYRMFGAAVFYDIRRYEEYTYEVSPLRRYTCKNRLWQMDGYPGAQGKNRELGRILKTVECVMREKYAFSPLQRPEKATKLLIDMAEKETEVYLAWKRAHTPRRIDIDIQKLSGIRQAAEQTRDRLLVEEDTADVVSPPPAPPPPVLPSEVEAGDSGLTLPQYRYLQALLCGKDAAAVAREAGMLPAVLVDGINEALFDRFSDTVIVYEGDTPMMLSDYEEELKGIVKL